MPDSLEISPVVLAAGMSHRFGSNKLLHPLTLHGVTLPIAAHSLLPWLDSFEYVTVVVGSDAEYLCNTIETAIGTIRATALRWVKCNEADKGLASSVKCGVKKNSSAAGWIIGLGDMPAIPSKAIIDVRNSLMNGAKIAAPYFKNDRGHPVGFSSNYYAELTNLNGDTGARYLLERDKHLIQRVEIAHAGILTDIDFIRDLQQQSLYVASE